MRWGYRLMQFVMRARPRLTPLDLDTARDVLPGSAYDLFEQMPPGDQVHALCVLRALRRDGTPSELEPAALLHDVGKAHGRLTLGRRTLIILLEDLGHNWLERLASPDPTGWRYPFYVHLHHAEMGAEKCQEAGCSQLTVALVRHHEGLPEAADGPGLRELLVKLKKADDEC